MAYSVNWSTKVITIPKADLTLVSASPEIYDLDVLAFWAQIHDIQDDEAGMSFPTIMQSNPPVTVGGLTLARVVEVINGYRVEFEDGQYQVNLQNANNNILDARVQNQVSINPNNSAGLVVVEGGAGGGLTPAQEATLNTIATLADELHKLQGLSSGNPMTVTQTARTVGGISLAISGDGTTTTTVTRQ